MLFACKLDTQSHAEAHSGGRSTNCWQRDADKAMMGPPRKMPSRPSASRILSSDKAERSSSAPPRSFLRSCAGQSMVKGSLEYTIEKWKIKSTDYYWND
ncbi:unnamed protein product [Caenorhabditis auriculariae]|uniref:Uncharacterized protein n=1 Tax=Caenorhabditis auriculariae TaxID=2777116 RepID=A0A8S1GMK3_9PELO|nr:unnamed protein product [Caenorhabditis auriculariae]